MRTMGSVLHTVVGGQFGSEAKGHVAAQIAAREVQSRDRVLGVRVAGPNAGHTAWSPLSGKYYALRQIPVMAVVHPEIQLYIGPGSEVDLDVLNQEISTLEDDGIPIWDRLLVSGEATVLTSKHIAAEAGMHERMGSTGKGVGAARADRIMRTAGRMMDLNLGQLEFVVRDEGFGILADYEYESLAVIIEGTQGYGLGLHAGFYPQCTSSDCRAIDFQAMAGINPFNFGTVKNWVVLRTFPIRVAGNSGPLYLETDWETLARESNGHIQPEKTTVTKKVRRVGRWDPLLAQLACMANKPAEIALTFLDYVDPKVADVDDWDALTEDALAFIDQVEIDTGHGVSMVTTGPRTAIWS